MKHCSRLIALLAAMLLLCCAAMAEEEVLQLYNDTTIYLPLNDVNGSRASLLLTQYSTGAVDGLILWPGEADTSLQWSFSIPAGEADGDVLAYRNCVCTSETYLEDSEQTQVLYENGTGRIVPGDDGFYLWQDDQENAGQNCLFMLDDEALILSRYVDTVSQRASMELFGSLAEDDPPMDVMISWAESAETSRVWTMTVPQMSALFVDENTVLSYTDGTCRLVTTHEDGSNNVETIYENGTGSFRVCYTDGMDGMPTIGYQWQTDSGELPESCLFIPAMVEGPARSDFPEDNAAQDEGTEALLTLFDYIDELADADEKARLNALADQLSISVMLAVHSVTEEASGSLTLECRLCQVQMEQDSIAVSYDEHAEAVRMPLADTLTACTPGTAQGSFVLSIDAGSFAAWYAAAFPAGTEHDVPCFFYVRDDSGAVQMLVYAGVL